MNTGWWDAPLMLQDLGEAIRTILGSSNDKNWKNDKNDKNIAKNVISID